MALAMFTYGTSTGLQTIDFPSLLLTTIHIPIPAAGNCWSLLWHSQVIAVMVSQMDEYHPKNIMNAEEDGMNEKLERGLCIPMVA